MAVKTVQLDVSGMTCANCAGRIARGLLRLEGVKTANVDFRQGSATVAYEDTLVMPAELAGRITTLGYVVLTPQKRRQNRLRVAGVLVIVLAAFVLMQLFGVNLAATTLPLAESSMSLGMLFLVGLMTSVHCVAMCGGINLSQTLPGGVAHAPEFSEEQDGISKKGKKGRGTKGRIGRASWRRPLPVSMPEGRSRREGATGKRAGKLLQVSVPSLTYNLARIVSYTLVGAGVGALGGVISFSGYFKGIVQLVAGVFMVLMGLNMLGVFSGVKRAALRFSGRLSIRHERNERDAQPVHSEQDMQRGQHGERRQDAQHDERGNRGQDAPKNHATWSIPGKRTTQDAPIRHAAQDAPPKAKQPRRQPSKQLPRQPRNKSPLIVGLLTSIMPCGPLQAMQLYALSTGSALGGALSMGAFALGTLPLMFILGALASLLSSRFMRRALTAGAALVLLLGLTMFSNGSMLSGWYPSFLVSGQVAQTPALDSSGQTPALGGGQQTALGQTSGELVDGVQVVSSTLRSNVYPAITVQQGVPVKWIISAPQGSINGCNYALFIPFLGLEYQFHEGENTLEFTPQETGTFPYSCWMGMIHSSITVV